MTLLNVLVYEFVTAGGTFVWADSPPTSSLLREGTAMLTAVCRDLARISGVRPVVMWDARIEPVALAANVHRVENDAAHDQKLQSLLLRCDEALLIAPEFSGHLHQVVQMATSCTTRLLSPGPDFVELASDKCRTIDCLALGGVPVPPTWRCRRLADVPTRPSGQRWVLKPNDGAGSDRVTCCLREQIPPHQFDAPMDWCVQTYCPGRPASVAALCGGGQFDLLPGAWQHLDPADFSYLGGQLISDRGLVARAHRLATEALTAMPPTTGYVGVDLILGPSSDLDRVLEVNPRLTSSYIGLSTASESNLAQAMRDRARGQTPELLFSTHSLEFEAM